MSTVRVGIIGLGKMGILHAGLLSAMPSARVVALCDVNRILLRYARRFLPDARMVKEVEELPQFDLDAVYVTTPDSNHFEVVSKLLRFKPIPHIFVEKPLGRTTWQSTRMCEAVRSARATLLVNMVGYNRRYAVTFREARRMLGEGAVGKPLAFVAHAFSSDFVRQTWRGRGRSTPGNALRDLGCHALDLAYWFFGQMRVTGVQRLVERVEGFEVVRVTLRTEGDLEGRCDVSREVPAFRLPEVGLTVLGSRGTVRVTDDEVRLMLNDGKSHVWYRHDLSDWVPFLLADPSYFREDDSFVRAILEGHQVEPDFRTALEVDRVVDQVEAMLLAETGV
jgi:predicted dehydrogenase